MTPDGLKRLMLDEGKRNFVYNDATGKYITRGLLDPAGYPTIAYGRNLATRGLTDAECLYLLQNDITGIEEDLTAEISRFQNIPRLWQDVLVMIEYNTGNVSSWHGLLSAMGNLSSSSTAVAAEVRNSDAWRGVTHARYERMVQAIQNGKWVLT